ncbi:hypothetical protein HK101_004982, partial [Irineochytrium annulatum]
MQCIEPSPSGLPAAAAPVPSEDEFTFLLFGADAATKAGVYAPMTADPVATAAWLMDGITQLQLPATQDLPPVNPFPVQPFNSAPASPYSLPLVMAQPVGPSVHFSAPPQPFPGASPPPTPFMEDLKLPSLVDSLPASPFFSFSSPSVLNAQQLPFHPYQNTVFPSYQPPAPFAHAPQSPPTDMHWPATPPAEILGAPRSAARPTTMRTPIARFIASERGDESP